MIGIQGEEKELWTDIADGITEFHILLTQNRAYNSRSGWYVPSMSKQTSATLSGLLPFCAGISFLLNKNITVDMLLSTKHTSNMKPSHRQMIFAYLTSEKIVFFPG